MTDPISGANAQQPASQNNDSSQVSDPHGTLALARQLAAEQAEVTKTSMIAKAETDKNATQSKGKIAELSAIKQVGDAATR